MSSRYDVTNWYWTIGNDTTQVYSTAVGDFVPVTDAAYLAWVASGNAPSKFATAQELWDVLGAAGVALPSGAGLSDVEKTRQVNSSDKVIFQIAFTHENRIRALEGKAAITKAQFITAVKALL